MMPYVPLIDRICLHDLKIEKIQSKGQLAYLIAQVIDTYTADHGKSYSTFNDILGALEGTKLEFYRRVVAPYENGKLAENGDVFL